jgi:HEAT repeat protein
VVLGNVGTGDDVDVLTRALDDEEPPVRGHAAWALGKIGSPAAVEPLRAALVRGRPLGGGGAAVRTGGARRLTAAEREVLGRAVEAAGRAPSAKALPASRCPTTIGETPIADSPP